MKIMAGDRVFGVGTTGSGKSYLFRRLLCRLPDVIVVDPKHGFEWEKSPMKYGKGVITTDFREVVKHIGPEPIIYRPSLAECAAGIPWFWIWVWERANCRVYVDEVQPITRPTQVPYEMARCIQMGRSKNIGVWCGTQRPARVPASPASASRPSCRPRKQTPRRGPTSGVESWRARYGPRRIPHAKKMTGTCSLSGGIPSRCPSAPLRGAFNV